MDWREKLRNARSMNRWSFKYQPNSVFEVRIIRALRPVGRFLARLWRFLTKIHVLVVVTGYVLLIIAVYMFVKNPDFKESLIGCPRSNIDQTANSVVMLAGDKATGSAFWLNNDTLITNNHVIDHNPNLFIYTATYAKIGANVIATDSLRDIAIVKVVSPVPHYIPEKSKTIPSLADEVYAIGYPEGKNLTVTKGIVSALTSDDYDDRGYIQTDAAINPGNSGGILVDNCGRVLGMNTQTLQGAQNIGYAIDIDQVYSKANSMIAAVRNATPQEQASAYPSEQTEVVAKYYTTLGGGDLQGAYDFYAKTRQTKLPYSSWQVGLQRTVFIRLVSVGITDKPNTVTVHFYATETKLDNFWEYTTGEFQGTWTLVRENGLWKMDESNIKLIKTFE